MEESLRQDIEKLERNQYYYIAIIYTLLFCYCHIHNVAARSSSYAHVLKRSYAHDCAIVQFRSVSAVAALSEVSFGNDADGDAEDVPLPRVPVSTAERVLYRLVHAQRTAGSRHRKDGERRRHRYIDLMYTSTRSDQQILCESCIILYFCYIHPLQWLVSYYVDMIQCNNRH